MTATAIEVNPERASLPVCLFENPYRLVSLLELMRIAQIAKVVGELRTLWTSSNLASSLDPLGRARQGQLLDEHLNTLDALCVDLDLPMSRLHIEDARKVVRVSHGLKTIDVMEQAIMVLSNNIEKELSLKLFLILPHDKARVFDDCGFGDAVSVAFPSVQYDAQEAARCYALGRNTASVFHLMRILEIGLAVLGKRFSISADHTNWETVINQIEKAIGVMDKDPNRPADWKDEREFYSQCASHFRVVKNAWRNYTAHARGKYDEQEALDMLGNVRGFMQKIATRLHE